MRPFIQYLLTNEYAMGLLIIFAIVGIITTITFLTKIIAKIFLHKNISYKYTWR